jgi:serine/threonine protein kinase
MQMPLLNNRYGLVSQIGRGGMGVVYKAVDTFLGNRYVAVKEMSHLSLSPHEATYAIEAFKREALMLATLAHQNLPRIYDHFNQGRSSYLVMDFIDGYTLDELMQQTHDQKLPMDQVLLIAEQLCSVFAYLHSRQPPIIFRDIKPANVMITQEKDHIYLIDFGIARFFKPGQLRDTLAFGTAGYASPEQYGLQTNEHSDMYSLGATLHQLLTGIDPSQSKVPFYFPPIRAYRSQVPLSLINLVMQMLQVDSTKRPKSMQQIKQEIQLTKQEIQSAPAAPNKSVNLLRSLQTRPTPGTTLLTYRHHTDCVTALSWSPDGKSLASTSLDKTVHLWSPIDGSTTLIYKKHSSYIYALAWSPDGQRLASSSFGDVHVWEAASGETSLRYKGHSLWVYSLTWSPDGWLLASCGADSEVHLWNSHNGDTLFRYQGFQRVLRSLTWSNGLNTTLLATACEDCQLYSWDTISDDVPLLFKGHSLELTHVAWSPDDRFLLSTGRDKTVKIWDVTTTSTVLTYRGHTREVYTAAWSPDGSRIASAGADKTVHVWNASTGDLLLTYKEHTKEVHSLAWSPDGSRIASAGTDKLVRVWHAL